eukprot:COSAG06_NODE_49419_length_325_cov_1.292035_2_plen_55_part_01
MRRWGIRTGVAEIVCVALCLARPANATCTCAAVLYTPMLFERAATMLLHNVIFLS